MEPWKPGDRITAERLNQMMRVSPTLVVGTKGKPNPSKRPFMADYVCDGRADEQEIMAAIDDLPETGGRVLIMEGKYHLYDTIRVGRSNVILEGLGAGTFLYAYHSKPTILLLQVENVVLRNFRVHGYGDVITSRFWESYLRHALVENLQVKSMENHGMNLERMFDSQVRNCRDEGSAKCGIRMAVAERNVIAGCRIVGCGWSGVAGQDESHDNQIVGNYVVDCGWHGIHLRLGCDRWQIHGNYIWGCSRAEPDTYSGITIEGVGVFMDDNSIQFNVIRHGNRQKYGVLLAESKVQRTIVANNDLYSSGLSGAIQDNGTGTVYLGGNKT